MRKEKKLKETKIYKFYLITNKDDKLIKMLNTMDIHFSGDKIVVLYAWTTDKNIANKYSKSRNKDKLFCKEDSVDYDELEYIKSNMMVKHIEKKKLYIDDKPVRLVMTRFEYINAIEEFSENINDDYVNSISVNIDIFRNSSFKILDDILYSYNYYMLYGTDEEMEVADYNMSYNRNISNFYQNDITKLCYVYRDIIDMNGILDEVKV